MFRSLISLLFVANVTTGDVPNNQDLIDQNFNEVELLEVYAIPKKNKKAIKPLIEAKAALLLDVDTGLVLYEKNSKTQLAMASLTKIMTAIVILESHKLNEVVTVQSAHRREEVGVRIWLYDGEKITVENLLIGLLVPSGGDAALALAEYHSGSVEAFAKEMNQKAKELGLNNTQFKNPIGLDEEGHYSSAEDLATLTRYALRFKAFRDIVTIQHANIKSTNGKIDHDFYNTNYLLSSYLDIRGVKTGTTDEAGKSLINVGRKNGHEVLTILLNSPDRFQESKIMIDWAFSNFKW